MLGWVFIFPNICLLWIFNPLFNPDCSFLQPDQHLQQISAHNRRTGRKFFIKSRLLVAPTVGGLSDRTQMMTVSHRHPQTCLSLPLSPGIHLTVECNVLGLSWPTEPGCESTRPPRVSSEDGERVRRWTDTEKSQGMSGDSVYSTVEICGGTVQMSLFVQAAQTEVHPMFRKRCGFESVMLLHMPTLMMLWQNKYRVKYKMWPKLYDSTCWHSTQICFPITDN